MQQEQIQIHKEQEEEQKKRKKRLQKLRKKEDQILNQNIEQIKRELQEESKDFNQFLERLRKLGLVISQVYHCRRCNHMWLPRDYDPVFYSPYFVKNECTLEAIKPPNSCARCKSKYWNSPPKRKTKRTSIDQSDERLVDLAVFGSIDKLNYFGHDMITAPRLRAYIKKARKITAQFEKIAREKGIDLEDIQNAPPRKLTYEELVKQDKKMPEILDNKKGKV